MLTSVIAVVVIAGVLVSGWHRLGDQIPQVTFTALFALLLGGHQPFAYITHRMIDVGIGVATGLAVNVLVFPPLQLRPAEHAIRQWGNDIGRALEDLSAAAARDCQSHLERETAQLLDYSDARSAAQHLARLTSEIISEAAEHQAAPGDPARPPRHVPSSGWWR